MNRLPNWSRWLLFLPLSFIASISIYLLIKLLSSLFERFFLFQLLLILPGAGLAGYFFVAVAAKLIPKYKVAFSILMALSYGAFAAMLLTDKTTLDKIVQLSAYELYSLAVIGTLAAVSACYHTHVNQKSSVDDLDNLIALGQGKLPIQKSIIAEPDSATLENQVLHIISEFDSDAGKPKRKQLKKEKVTSLSDESEKLVNIYPEDSPSKKIRENVVISDSASNDIEAEILNVVSILNSNSGASKRKPILKEDRQRRATEVAKSQDVRRDYSPQQKLKKPTHLPKSTARKIEKQISPAMSDSDAKKIAPQRKAAAKDEQLIGFTETDKSTDALLENLFQQELPEATVAPERESGDSEQQKFHKPSESGQEIMAPQSEAMAKEDLISYSTESDQIGDFEQDVLMKQLSEEDNDIPISGSMASETLILKTPPGLSSETGETRSKQLVKDEALISLSELDQLIERYQDDSVASELTGEKGIPDPDATDFRAPVSQTLTELEAGKEEPHRQQLTNDDVVIGAAESNNLMESWQDESFLQDLAAEDGISYLDLNDLERQVLQTTTELAILIKESKGNRFTKYIGDFYKSIGEDENVALIHAEIFYLWCMMSTIFNFSIDSDFRKNLIKFFNAKVVALYLKWKELTGSNGRKSIAIDFNNFSYYSNQIRANNIHLNSSYQDTEAEMLFGKVVLAKIHESMGNRKIDVNRETILMPVQAYYELKQRVIEILNGSTNTICS